MSKISEFTARTAAQVDGAEFIVLADTDAVYNTVTASTISADDTDDSFNDSANGLAGFKVGTTINTSGFTDGSLNGSFVVSSVLSDGSKITVTSDLGASESAGNSITIDGLGINYKMLLSESSKYAALNGGTTQTASISGASTLDFSLYVNFVLTLTGNATLSNPSTEVTGQSGFIVFIQDGTGSRTVSIGSEYKTESGSGLTLSTVPGTVDIVPYAVQASGNILLGTPKLSFS